MGSIFSCPQKDKVPSNTVCVFVVLRLSCFFQLHPTSSSSILRRPASSYAVPLRPAPSFVVLCHFVSSCIVLHRPSYHHSVCTQTPYFMLIQSRHHAITKIPGTPASLSSSSMQLPCSSVCRKAACSGPSFSKSLLEWFVYLEI